jgi:hypothetical protein
MNHATRYGLLATIAGVAFFVTGIQKKVLSPVIGWIGVLGFIVVGLGAVTVGIVIAYRRNRTSLQAAMTTIANS